MVRDKVSGEIVYGGASSPQPTRNGGLIRKRCYVWKRVEVIRALWARRWLIERIGTLPGAIYYSLRLRNKEVIMLMIFMLLDVNVDVYVDTAERWLNLGVTVGVHCLCCWRNVQYDKFIITRTINTIAGNENMLMISLCSQWIYCIGVAYNVVLKVFFLSAIILYLFILKHPYNMQAQVFIWYAYINEHAYTYAHMGAYSHTYVHAHTSMMYFRLECLYIYVHVAELLLYCQNGSVTVILSCLFELYACFLSGRLKDSGGVSARSCWLGSRRRKL
jgi:hypothetical protein